MILQKQAKKNSAKLTHCIKNQKIDQTKKRKIG